MPAKSEKPETPPPVAPPAGVMGTSGAQPGQEPPSTGLTGLTGEIAMSDAKPKELSLEEVALITSGGSAAAQPSAPPPQQKATGGVTAWQNSQQISGLWTINQDRNAWVSVTVVGWKRLSTASASGVVALNMLGAHARQTNAPVNYRDEADGMIHEMYIW